MISKNDEREANKRINKASMRALALPPGPHKPVKAKKVKKAAKKK